MARDVEKTTPFHKDDKKPQKGKAAKEPHPVFGPMFGNFEAAKHRKLPRWAAPLLAAMLLFHVVLFTTMYVKTIWDIEQLERPKNSMDLAIAPPPPPPPPPPKGGVKPPEVKNIPRKMKVRDMVQPVKIEKQEVAQAADSDPNAVDTGNNDGAPGGVDLGVQVAAPPPPPPPPPPAPPQNVAPTALEASRVSGEKLISPDDVTKTEISRSGKDRLVGSYKLCITSEGNINTVSQLKSTGFPAYDNKIQNTIRGEWRYRPFMVNGKATAVCTAVTFIYSQK